MHQQQHKTNLERNDWLRRQIEEKEFQKKEQLKNEREVD